MKLIIITIFFMALSGCAPEQDIVPKAVRESSDNKQSANNQRTNKTATAGIAIPDRHAARVAEDILLEGGNAVDAAVATGFALAVTFIDAGNIGGGGFMLGYTNGQPWFLDYRETAPLLATRDMYLDENDDVVEDASLIGERAVGVPGTVAGLWAAHQRFGKLPWKAVLTPAIELAEEGFIPAQTLIDYIRASYDRFRGHTNFADYFGGISAGVAFVQPELAATLRRIAENGADEFYRGETAELLIAQMERNNGLITADDLEHYRVQWRDPLSVGWRDYVVLSAPPPSSGGIALIQLLKMKDYLADEFEGVTHNSPQYIHLIAEMEKRVFADRAEYLGDPGFVDIDVSTLISDEYVTRRAAEVNSEVISQLNAITPGLESPDTTHYSILDFEGNAVSNTYTINWEFGSGSVVEGAGFLLNNEMDDFSVKPGVPNIFGVVGNVANEIQPGKRMLSSMTPTILVKEGKPILVLGTPGGSTIFTTVFQTIINILDFDMSPLGAIGATRFHHQLLPPDLITYSVTVPLPEKTISELAARGYRAQPHGFEFGDVQVVWDDKGTLKPAADPRDRGIAKVIERPADNTL